MVQSELSGIGRPDRDALVAKKPVEVVASSPEEDRERAEAAEARRREEHPTRRADRPPNLRKADEALARDLGLDGEATRWLFE